MSVLCQVRNSILFLAHVPNNNWRNFQISVEHLQLIAKALSKADELWQSYWLLKGIWQISLNRGTWKNATHVRHQQQSSRFSHMCVGWAKAPQKSRIGLTMRPSEPCWLLLEFEQCQQWQCPRMFSAGSLLRYCSMRTPAVRRDLVQMAKFCLELVKRIFLIKGCTTCMQWMDEYDRER